MNAPRIIRAFHFSELMDSVKKEQGDEGGQLLICPTFSPYKVLGTDEVVSNKTWEGKSKKGGINARNGVRIVY